MKKISNVFDRNNLPYANALKTISFIMLFVLVLFFLTLLTDQVLGIIGYPSAREIQITHPKNYHGKRDNIEFSFDFETNSKGLRYKEIPIEGQDGEVRVLVLGDSFVEGEGVQYDETFTNILESDFTRRHKRIFRFINGGLSNTGPLQYLRLFKYVGLQYKPDYVLICIYANDVSDSPEQISPGDFYRTYTHGYDSKRPGLRRLVHWTFPRLYTMYALLRDRMREGTPPDGFVDKVEYFAKKNNISEDRIRDWKRKTNPKLIEYAEAGKINPSLISYPLLRPAYWKTGLDIDTPRAKRKFETMALILDELVRLAHSEQVRTGLVFIPAVWQYDPRVFEAGHPMIEGGMVRKGWLTERTVVQKRLYKWATSHSVPFLDMTGIFRQKIMDGQVLNYSLDLHWNSKGHAASAEAIGTWLEKEVLSDDFSDGRNF